MERPLPKEVWIRNFKSFKDQRIQLRRFSVVVGPNATGKTNFVEFFKFLRKALVEELYPAAPYLDWWGYRNIVWRGREELPIVAGLRFDISGRDVVYEVTFGGAGGEFRILGENLVIVGVLAMEREGRSLRIKYDKKFIQTNRAMIMALLREEYLPLRYRAHRKRLTPEDLIEQTVELPYVTLKSSMLQLPPSSEYWFSWLPQVSDTWGEMRWALRGFFLLRPLDIRQLRAPSSLIKEHVLAEDGSNLQNLLYNWFIEKGRLPERIEAALSALFPGFRIGFEPTADGRVFVKVYEDDAVLHPPGISDGFYKVLAILAALEMKPSLLAIDEVENSLHAKALEYVIDELRNSDTVVILTTHSPAVVDMVDLADLLIAEKGAEGTLLRRIKEPEEARSKMKELGITPSEMWLYGKLGK